MLNDLYKILHQLFYDVKLYFDVNTTRKLKRNETIDLIFLSLKTKSK